MGLLGVISNKGNINFIPNSKEIELISSWRPISFLNVSYKIIAKALYLILRPLLP